MNKILRLLGILAFCASTLSRADGLTFRELVLKGGGLRLQVGVQRPAGKVKGDILYFTGFADRLDNHGPLFETWTKAGYRVISFDYPSHGQTKGVLNHLDLFGLSALANFALEVEQATREDARRPLFLAGWSTGGLLAVRMAQENLVEERKLAGLILFAPGVSVYNLVGEKGFVTERTLTHNPNPPHHGPIRPRSPLLHPFFAASLVAGSLISQKKALPGIPSLVILAGDKEDVYARTSGLKKWVENQRGRGARIAAAQCLGARHELDNEPATGAAVRSFAVEFPNAVLGGRPFTASDPLCPSF